MKSPNQRIRDEGTQRNRHDRDVSKPKNTREHKRIGREKDNRDAKEFESLYFVVNITVYSIHVFVLYEKLTLVIHCSV